MNWLNLIEYLDTLLAMNSVPSMSRILLCSKTGQGKLANMPQCIDNTRLYLYRLRNICSYAKICTFDILAFNMCAAHSCCNTFTNRSRKKSRILIQKRYAWAILGKWWILRSHCWEKNIPLSLPIHAFFQGLGWIIFMLNKLLNLNVNNSKVFLGIAMTLHRSFGMCDANVFVIVRIIIRVLSTLHTMAISVTPIIVCENAMNLSNVSRLLII